MTDEYPGVSRLVVEWTDPDEIAFNWPFNANGREVASVEVDGIEYVNAEKLKATNGELCAQVNELERLIANRDESIHNLTALLDKRQARIAELEAGRTCFSDNEPVMLYNDKWHVFRCSECHHQVNLCYNPKPNYCPNCGAKVVG